MSNEINPVTAHSTFSEPAEVRLVSQSLWAQSDYKLAYVLVSSRIYWKVANRYGTNKPQSLLDFRNAESFELGRLDDGTWDDVGEYVKVDECNGRTRITVSRRPRERKRRKCAALVHEPQLEILPSTHEQQEEWVKQVRARIAPWSLLQQEVTDVANRAPTSGVMEYRNARNGLVTSSPDTEPSSLPTNTRKRKWSDFLSTLPEMMAKLSIVDKLTAQGAGTVGSGVALATLVTRVEHVAETAKVIGDATKFVAGLSSIFQLVALGAQGASMWATAIRGQKMLPAALDRIGILLEYVLESMTEIMKPSQGVNQIDTEFVFDALRQTVSTMDLAETQLMRRRASQIVNAEDVKEVEKKLDELTHRVVTARAISKMCTMSEVPQPKKEQHIWCDEPHHVRPSLSAFFSGRTKELDTLREMLEKWGSAVITQYGGVGKTELMIAFADRVEREKAVPGGVFWVMVGGGERDVIESLARLVEKLAGRRMGEEERRDPNLVVAWLKQGLGERRGRWLLCLDNADDGKASGILNEVCGIAGGMDRTGWVVVTSRQGQPHIWREMEREQKLVLKPLCLEDAMVALWRQARNIKTSVADDDGIMSRIKELECVDAVEYRALKELCGDEGRCSLGGLPLALVQAGTYMARFECSFVRYRTIFENANRIEDMQDIMRRTEEVKPIRESQRSIWTTWKISVRQLSEKSYSVLRAMAMLGPCGLGEAMVKGILEEVQAGESRSIEWMFRKIVIEDLVQGSSLICRDDRKRDGQEECVYRMHRLVRLFIVRDIKRESAVWKSVYSLALVSVHKAVESELKQDGTSFDEFPDMFGDNHREVAAHAVALVEHYILSAQGAEIGHAAEFEDLHWYSAKVMEFMGKLEETVLACERLVDILEHQQAANRTKSCIGRFMDMRHRRNQGKKDKSRIAAAYDTLGVALMRNGKLNDALSKLEHSLEMYLAIYGPDKPHSSIATSLNNLGNLYKALGQLDKALEKHEQSLQMYLAIHGPDKPHSDIATSLNNLGCLYKDLGQLDKALEKHEQSLETYRAIHGHKKPHSDIAMALQNIGSVYQRLDKLENALEMHEQSLEMELAIHGHGNPHPDVATALNNLANVYQRLGKLDKALENHEQSLEVKLAIHGHGKPHSAIATSLGNIGSVYQGLGKLERALEVHEQSLEMYRAVHGDDKPHPAIATSLGNLGSVYQGLGKLDKALESYEQSLQMYRAVHGPNNPHLDIAASLNNLGLLYGALGDLDKALEKHQQCLEMYRAVHGHNAFHSDIAGSLNNMADVHCVQGNLVRAAELFERSVEMLQNVHGAGVAHPDVAVALSNLGRVYQAQVKFDEALQMHEQSLELYRTIHGRDRPHPDIARSLNSIGLVYHQQEKLDRAAESFEQSVEMLKNVYGSSSRHRNVKAVLSNLIDVYEDQGRWDDALAIREQINSSRRTTAGEGSSPTNAD